MKKTKSVRKSDVAYCPFMVDHYGVPFLFLWLFGFGSINTKQARCLKHKCALWSHSRNFCSFRKING